MKLDKTVEPLATDTTIKVRPRSALGLKYVEVTPGKGDATYTAGDTIPLRNASEGLELEDVFSTLDEDTRDNARSATEGFGDAFAARGASLNIAIQALNPFFTSLQPVMTSLSDPDTQLDQFFLQLGRTAAQVAPVATVQADLFSNMATTFAAISSDPGALQATIEKSPPTIDTSIRSFRVQRPFLADFADLSRRLRPAVNELPRSLPAINRRSAWARRSCRARSTSTTALRRALLEARGPVREPEHAARHPRPAHHARGHPPGAGVRGAVPDGLQLLQLLLPPARRAPVDGRARRHGPGAGPQDRRTTMQANTYGDIEASRPWDVPPGVDPSAPRRLGMKLGRIYATPYQPAIDAQGNADCQNGQLGFIRGPLAPECALRAGPGARRHADRRQHAGVLTNNFPILSGGTFKSRELGIDNLQDVDKLR